MAVNQIWSDWRKHGRMSQYAKTSPNLMVIQEALKDRGWQFLGGRVVRSVRGGSSPSIHSWGAAIDTRHESADERRLVVDWLIEHSSELEVSEVHDYAGLGYSGPAGTGGYWRAGRGWKAAGRPSGDPNMHQPSAKWLHIETTINGWGNATSISARGVEMPGAHIGAAQLPHLWDIAARVDRVLRPWVGHPNCQADDTEVEGIQTRHWRAYFREVVTNMAGQRIALDGPWSLPDIAALRNVAVIGQVPGAAELTHLTPESWAVIDYLAGLRHA